MKLIYLSIVSLAFIGQWVPVHGFTYMAVVPNSIRPNSELVIPIKLNTIVYGEIVTVQMFKRDEKKVLAEKTEVVNGQLDVTVSLQVPSDISWGSYRVNITGTGPIPFKNSTLVYGTVKSVSLFVQTDKAIYKPGDTVHYRVFAVNGSLSSVSKNLDIEIFDPKGNKIDEIINVNPGPDLSVSGDLSLSNDPPLGSWRIDVKTPELGENAKQTYRFEVKEYVLPKFEVTVTLPSSILLNSPSVEGKVKATYVFGKPVQGTISLDIKRKYGYGFFAIASARTELSIDGVASFSIPKEIFERLSQNLEYETFVVSANVTEGITGITLLGSGELRFQQQTYQLEFFPNMANNYKPGFNSYDVWVKVTDKDGNPPVRNKEKVKFDITYFFDQKVNQIIPNNLTFTDFELLSPFIPGETVLLKTIKKGLDQDGSAKFKLDIPDGTATLSIKASFGKQTVVKQVSRFRSPGEIYLNIKVQNPVALKIGDIASFKVENSKGATKAHYLVISKGLVAKAGTVKIGPAGKGSLDLQVTRDMAPSSRIVVYFVADNGEIVADGKNFVVEDIFENKVTITFDKVQAEPGNQAVLKVKAEPGSFVSVLAVDKSVRLMKEGNDITKDRVSSELRQYGDSPWLPATAKWGSILPWTFTADDASDIFNYARLNVLTDALLPEFNLYTLMRRSKVTTRAFSSNVKMDSIGLSGVAGGGNEPTTPIRKDFPETWIWKTALATNGEAIFPDIVPDTITTFVGTAFALNSQAGLGVTDSTADLTVIKPFFISFQPPYSVIRGETAVLQANIFNYSPEDLNVALTLKGSPDFVRITIGPNGQEIEATGDQVRCILVKANTPTPVFYNIKPKTLGTPKIQVEASASTASRTYSDAVLKEIRVKAEGEEKEDNIPTLISLKKIGRIELNYKWPVDAADLPDVVPGSEKSRVSLIGDIFGPSFKNLENLIKLPYGCGEQNMLNFAPSVYTAEYMKVTGRFDSNVELQDKIKRALRTGYQRQLLYQRRDGSFSAFGNADSEGSAWLTAFVVKCFAQAKKLNLNYMDPMVIEKAVKYILDKQLPDGTFLSTGTVHHRAMQGGSVSSTRSFTAFVTIALHEVKESGFLHELSLSKLVEKLKLSNNYLNSSVDQMTNDYERAISAYALKLAGLEGASALLTALMQSDKKSGVTAVYWKSDYHSLEIEVASYVLMTVTLNSATDTGFPILKWLISNRGPFGGYASTQDTVLAIQATSQYAALVYSKEVDMTIKITPTLDGVVKPTVSLSLTADNQDVLQFKEIGKFDTVSVVAEGQGLAMLDHNIFYNVFKDEKQSSFLVTLNTTSDPTNKNSYLLTACAKYNIPNRKSDMAIIDIGVVSGFQAEKDLVKKTPLIKRIESASGRLIIYFDEIPSKEVCVDVPVQRVSLVSKVLPATVVVYSYYYPEERQMKSYLPANLESSELCKICGTECGCGPDPNNLPLGQCGIGYK